MSAFIAKLMKYAPFILSVIGALAGGGAWLRPLPSPAPVPSSKISIPASVTVQAGEPAFVKAETASKSVLWITPDEGVKIIGHDRLSDSTEAIIIPPPSGECRVMAITVDGSNPVHSDWCTITVNGARPPPGPQPTPPDPSPQPAPQPTPPKKPAHLQVVVIDDWMQRDAELTALLTNKFWAAARTLGHDVRMVDVSRTDYVQHYAKEIKKNGDGYPIIIVKNSYDGSVLNDGDYRLPADIPSLRIFMKKYTDNLP